MYIEITLVRFNEKEYQNYANNLFFLNLFKWLSLFKNILEYLKYKFKQMEITSNLEQKSDLQFPWRRVIHQTMRKIL